MPPFKPHFSEENSFDLTVHIITVIVGIRLELRR